MGATGVAWMGFLVWVDGFMYGLKPVPFDYLVEFGGDGDLGATGVAWTGFLFFGLGLCRG